jgi:hypothetical protein
MDRHVVMRFPTLSKPQALGLALLIRDAYSGNTLIKINLH